MGNDNRFPTPDDCYNTCGGGRDQKGVCVCVIGYNITRLLTAFIHKISIHITIWCAIL